MRFKACLNGRRTVEQHSGVPCTPDELAADAVAVAALGVEAVHVHPRRLTGRESLAPADIGASVEAIRAAVPGVPVGVSTGAWIEPDVRIRLDAIGRWKVVPDFASVNLSEPGAAEVAALLLDRGVAVEAGVWDGTDAVALVDLGLAHRCLRILLEPREDSAEAALATVAAAEAVLDEAAVTAPRLLHGHGNTAWPLLREALRRDYAVRVGLEDTVRLPDGSPAAGNAALVVAAASLGIAGPAGPG